MDKGKNKNNGEELRVHTFLSEIKNKSDKLMNFFLVIFYAIGLLLSFYYDTWLIGAGVGSLSLIAYYSTKYFLPNSDLYQYVLSAVFGIFMAQYIYQMHGMFEMHFIAFIGSAILVTYQNWKLQIPLAIVVIVHHAIFGYIQYIGYDKIYFTQLQYMSLQTFIIHIILVVVILYICGLWAYRFRKHSLLQIEQIYEMGRLQEEKKQKDILEKTNEELIKTNKELDRFVYSASHDLRSPLASMLGLISLCEMDLYEKDVQEYLLLLKTCIKKLDGFIIDILDYSKNTRLEINREEINFRELLNDVLNNLKFMCDPSENQIDFRVKIENKTTFYSDKRRLNVILNNLISNAFRYKNEYITNPCVDTEVKIFDNYATIRIKDNGIGIQKEYQEKVFEMFYRVSSKSVGSGLGLYIVKETVEKLHGRIEMRSEFGKGSEFNIYLPNLSSVS